MTGQAIQLGIVGYGFIGRRVVLATTAILGMTAVVVVDLDATLWENVAGELSVPHAYSDYHELLENLEINAVYLGTPPDGA